MGKNSLDGWDCLQCCGNLSPQPHYPPNPKGTSMKSVVEGSEAKAVFCVMGMTCSASAGSVEKAIKRLPGIRDAVVDVLNDKAQVLYYPSMINVSILFLYVFNCSFL